MTHVGKRIRQRMQEIPGMTTKQLAERLDMHEQTVYDIFKRDNVSSDLLLRISKVMDTPVTYFLEESVSLPAASPPNSTVLSSPPPVVDSPVTPTPAVAQQLVPPMPLPQPTVIADPTYKLLYEDAKRRIQQLEAHLNDKDLIIKLLLEKIQDK